ncbi:hypothetical protein SKAU_G00357720 [Synaphobranchus kaupii]|uniref:Uncharacterized protein n=1 Tax=Synaphobranchus kaupii TaxID=118154 RepID=A0A9Q1IGS7_SYNKA|nr:hypothetical protein SKAU_G00357720 [Synaphobranchus kaupii]
MSQLLLSAVRRALRSLFLIAGRPACVRQRFPHALSPSLPISPSAPSSITPKKQDDFLPGNSICCTPLRGRPDTLSLPQTSLKKDGGERMAYTGAEETRPETGLRSVNGHVASSTVA